MSEARFTPGPWGAYRSNRFSEWIINQVSGPGYVCTMPLYEHRQEQCEANMRLVVAAPDMREALQCAQNVLTLLQDEVSRLGCRADQVTEKIAAALAKANGGQA